MTHKEFFASLKRDEIARIYLFQGEEAYSKAKALEALKKKLLPQGLEALNETVLVNPSADAIIAASLTLPMMSERRLVIVRECNLLLSTKASSESTDAERVAQYIDNPMDTTCLVFYCESMPDARKKLLQTLKKKAVVVQFDKLSDADLLTWMQTQVRPYIISQSNAMLLAFTAGDDLQTLSREIAKLMAYMGERQEITKEDIEAVITPSLACTVFQLVDILMQGKEAEAFKLLASMLEHGQSRISILAMIARQYRNLLQLFMLKDDKLPESYIQKSLGIPAFAVRKLAQQALGENVQSLRQKLDLCVDTDFAIKRGQMREDVALDRVILLLCSGHST